MITFVRETAPGKIILFGEHAVVYGQPAIAVPVQQVQALATVESSVRGKGLTIVAHDLKQVIPFAEAPEDDPLGAIVRLTLSHLDVSPPDAKLTIQSSIPMAGGLGSGAAVSTAIVQSLASYLGHQLTSDVISQLVFEVEKMHHGTPSGIDNTVVVYRKPVFFVRSKRIETFDVAAPLHLLIGDTGVPSSTRIAVGRVRTAWKGKRTHYEGLFAEIGRLVFQARALLEVSNDLAELGDLMNRNHDLLVALGVSSPELQDLVDAARRVGALGAKLSGSGLGGNMIALVKPDDSARITAALRAAGAVRVIATTVFSSTRDREP